MVTGLWSGKMDCLRAYWLMVRQDGLFKCLLAYDSARGIVMVRRDGLVKWLLTYGSARWIVFKWLQDYGQARWIV